MDLGSKPNPGLSVLRAHTLTHTSYHLPVLNQIHRCTHKHCHNRGRAWFGGGGWGTKVCPDPVTSFVEGELSIFSVREMWVG